MQDTLSTILAQIEAVRTKAASGIQTISETAFGTAIPGNWGQFYKTYVPENITSSYDEAVPLTRPEQVPRIAAYYSYDRQKQRFVDLHGSQHP